MVTGEDVGHLERHEPLRSPDADDTVATRGSVHSRVVHTHRVSVRDPNSTVISIRVTDDTPDSPKVPSLVLPGGDAGTVPVPRPR